MSSFISYTLTECVCFFRSRASRDRRFTFFFIRFYSCLHWSSSHIRDGSNSDLRDACLAITRWPASDKALWLLASLSLSLSLRFIYIHTHNIYCVYISYIYTYISFRLVLLLLLRETFLFFRPFLLRSGDYLHRPFLTRLPFFFLVYCWLNISLSLYGRLGNNRHGIATGVHPVQPGQ